MKKFLTRVRVVATQAVTYLVGAAAVIPFIADDIADQLPAGAAGQVTKYALLAVAWIGAAVSIIRRVTPVLPQDRGLLPPPSGLVDRAGNPVPRDPGEVSIGLIVIVIVCVLAAVFVLKELGWLS